MSSTPDKSVTPGKSVKFSLQLPTWYHRQVLTWARIRGESRAAAASRLLIEHLNQCRGEMEEEVEAIAKSIGIEPEELMRLWESQSQSDSD